MICEVKRHICTFYSIMGKSWTPTAIYLNNLTPQRRNVSPNRSANLWWIRPTIWNERTGYGTISLVQRCLSTCLSTGHFYFTKLLLPMLTATAKTSPDGKTRVVNTSSIMNQFSNINYDTLKDGPERKKLSTQRLYAQSKFVRQMLLLPKFRRLTIPVFRKLGQCCHVGWAGTTVRWSGYCLNLTASR